MRRGVASVWAVIVLATLTLLLSTGLSATLSGRSWLDRRQAQAQALWLARSGIEITTARLLTDPFEAQETLELVAGTRLDVRLKKTGDVLVMTSEARVEWPQVTRTLERRCRRVVENGKVRIEVVP
jgi:hypothetical protein